MKEFRLLVTNACNFNCYFCHREGNYYLNTRCSLTADDYVFLYKLGRDNFGYKTISITGGEPLLRKDIMEIFANLYEEGAEITLTTNFSLYDQTDHVDLGKYLKKVNVSLHSLDSETYMGIIGKNVTTEEICEKICDFAKNNTNTKVGLNCTLTKHNNSQDTINNLIVFSKKVGNKINFSKIFTEDIEEQIDISNLKDMLGNAGYTKKSCGVRSDVYIQGESVVKVSKILCENAGLQSNPEKFCKENRDLFITSDGKIDICRVNNINIDLYNDIKHKDEKAIIEKIRKALEMLGEGCPYHTQYKKFDSEG